MNFEFEKNTPIGFFIIDYSTGGGVERVTANLMHQFYEKGYQNLFLISLKSQLSKPTMKYPKMKKIEIISEKSNQIVEKLSQFLSENKIEHLIFQGDNMTIALEVLSAAKKVNVNAYPQYHGSPFAYLKKYADAERSNYHKIIFAKLMFPFKRHKFKRFISKSQKGIFCVSQGAADEIKTLFKNDKKIKSKIQVVHNPILINPFDEFLKEKKIVLASRLESRHKNAFLAIKAWSIIADKYPEWELVILGDGSLKSKMIDFCKKNNIKNIQFKGFVENVDEVLSKSMISLNVSNCEGFSMSIAEAIAQKNAIVSTDSDGGVKDMLKHNETALISPKNDEFGLAENISKLIENKDLRQSIANNAYQNLLKLCNEDTSKVWLEILSR